MKKGKMSHVATISYIYVCMFFQGRNYVKTVIRDANHVSADLHMAFGFWPLLGLLVAISVPPQLFVPPLFGGSEITFVPRGHKLRGCDYALTEQIEMQPDSAAPNAPLQP